MIPVILGPTSELVHWNTRGTVAPTEKPLIICLKYIGTPLMAYRQKKNEDKNNKDYVWVNCYNPKQVIGEFEIEAWAELPLPKWTRVR